MTSLILAITFTLSSFAQKTKIDQRSGVEISFSAEGSIFTTSWNLDKINAQGISFNKSEYAKSERILLSALQKYPVPIIKANLKKVYILKSLYFMN
ncbi:hypothetical protein BZARG_1191 [Bizionia argentinensis JUB59]|uniref:Uncharacterized protein n=1 Tax=Bizionia argentinensis JUB59 TaxID=1046627 RepID=G2ECS2_9FLAO|nr:hypothetical protein [Bizionia argentinensis]EGV43722.1 hypothetical protein BZARG_1191 [Bizionia argentinensis JUB59]